MNLAEALKAFDALDTDDEKDDEEDVEEDVETFTFENEFDDIQHMDNEQQADLEVAPGFARLEEAMRKVRAIPPKNLTKRQRKPVETHHAISGDERMQQLEEKRLRDVEKREMQAKRKADAELKRTNKAKMALKMRAKKVKVTGKVTKKVC
jgi:hypothetical protein